MWYWGSADYLSPRSVSGNQTTLGQEGYCTVELKRNVASLKHPMIAQASDDEGWAGLG